MTPTNDKKSLLDQYPVTKITDCIFCRGEIRLVRRGSGKPWRGRLDYWYTEDPRDDHGCIERILQLGETSA